MPQLKPNGLVLYEEELVDPAEDLPSGARALAIPATRFAEELGRRPATVEEARQLLGIGRQEATSA